MESKLVFCVNCKYYDSDDWSSYCIAPFIEDRISYVYGVSKGYMYIDSELNPNIRSKGCCPYYQRKWWKFWIR